tara:strand:+ start:248 stop:775 length:528 start_codon:yes stop_codon:yes gene_type:complete
MVFLILELLYTTLFSGFFLIGVGTSINKLGDFFKIIEEEEDNNFKKGFDKITNDSLSEFNKFFISSHIVISKFIKLLSISYELIIGEKIIKKNKDGNVIICDKNVIMEKYECKIEELEKKILKFKEISKQNNTYTDSSSDDEDEEEIEGEYNEDDEDDDDNDDNEEKEIIKEDDK